MAHGADTAGTGGLTGTRGSTGVRDAPPPLPLARAGVDRAAHRRDDDAWLARAWADPRTRVLVVDDGRVRVRDPADGSDAPRLVLVPPAEAPEGERFLLGVDGEGVDGEGVAVFAVAGPLGAGTAPDGDAGVRLSDLRGVGASLEDSDAGLLVHAVALEAWHRTHRRCPRCGAATETHQAGHQRRCPEDGSLHFPRTDPAVIMLVVDADDRALLGRQTRWPEGRFSTLAGFVEPGESLEQAVAREVGEEVGLTVTDAQYVGSQPWPFPASLMLGFVARACDVDVTADGDEIAEARWFTREGLSRAVATGEVRLPPPVSIARRLVEGWYGGPLPDPGGRW